MFNVNFILNLLDSSDTSPLLFSDPREIRKQNEEREKLKKLLVVVKDDGKKSRN
jgi:hypothetical protein